MKKIQKIISIITVVLMIMVVSTKIYATEEVSINDFVIISDSTIENISTKELYVFVGEKERDIFLNELREKEVSTCACLPGDPGYPNCTDRYIVRTEKQTLSGTISDTGYLTSNNYLCGNNGWVFGPGNISYSASAGVTASFSYNNNGYGVNVNISYSVTRGASFYVPAGKKGNIKYKARFKLVPSRYKYTWNNGDVTYSTKFYISTLIDGGFYLYLQ